ncbi:MAG: hypothetical protein ACQES4_11470 [Bacillota bacterium]
MRHYTCIVVLVLLITLAVGNTALAESGSFTYRKQYDINGLILMKIQAGSDYDRSGQHKSLIQGEGSLQRFDYIAMSKDGMIVETDNYWDADPDSLRGLEVAGTFRLHDQYEGEEADGVDGEEAVPAADSPQMFAVSVDANSGESGSMSQNIGVDASGESSMFSINQHAQTSEGTVKRYIDITDPESGAYLFEDTEIKGQVNITEYLNSSDPNEDFSITTASSMLAKEGSEDKQGSSDSSLFVEEINQEEDGKDGEEDSVMAVLGESIDYEVEEEPALVIDGGEIFKSVVPLGTEVEELGLDEEIVFQSELIAIKDIYVKWDDQLFGEYDPNQVGSYTFAGELIFPETVAYDDKVLIFHVVDVVEDESEELEDEVHGGENGEDEETDEESDR